MQETGSSRLSFDELWKIANENPVEHLETGDDEDVAPAEAVGAWLGDIADACLADGLISEADHGELRKCSETFARILGAVPTGALGPRLLALSDPEA